MKQTINRSKLEQIINESVRNTISESFRTRENNKRQMNEAQLHQYIQNIINEELENEAFWKGLRAMGGQVFGDAGTSVQGAAKSAGRAIGNAIGNFASSAGKAVSNGYNSAAQYGRDVMQTGRNASASADVQKLVQNIDGIYQKYGRTLTKSQQSSIRSAKSALTQLAAAFGNGVNA